MVRRFKGMADTTQNLERRIIEVLVDSETPMSAHEIAKALTTGESNIAKSDVNKVLYRSEKVASNGEVPPRWKVVQPVEKEEKAPATILFIDADNLGDVCKEVDNLKKLDKWPASINVRIFCGPAYAGALKDIASRVTLNEKSASDIDLAYNVIVTTIKSPSTKIIIASRDAMLVTLANYLKEKGFSTQVIRNTTDLFGVL
jgi:hypothetical protein